MANTKPATRCKLDDCARSVASHGLCNVHWKRFERRGTTDKFVRTRSAYTNTNGYVYERVTGERQGVLQHRIVMEAVPAAGKFIDKLYDTEDDLRAQLSALQRAAREYMDKIEALIDSDTRWVTQIEKRALIDLLK